MLENGDYWTSGTDSECPEKFTWCSKEAQFASSQVTWKTGHPSTAGDCVYVQIKNGTQNGTVFGTSDCNERKKFVCEVRHKGAEGRALAVECMALWDITEGLKFTKECKCSKFLLISS
jgi:hypothetical protein